MAELHICRFARSRGGLAGEAYLIVRERIISRRKLASKLGMSPFAGRGLETQAAKLFAEIASPEERAELLKLAVRVDALSAQADANRFHS